MEDRFFNMNEYCNCYNKNFSISKINVILSTLGFSERYIAFNYLSFIIIYMHRSKSDSSQTYKQAIAELQKKYGVSARTITFGLSYLLSCCTNPELTSKTQYNISNKRILNRIRLVKEFVEKKFFENI